MFQRLSLALVLALTMAAGLGAVDVSAQSRPFVWPTKGRITQGFGCTGFHLEPRYRNCAHFHYGLDIANQRGTPIYAAADGVVTLAGWDPWIHNNPDWMVIIKHAHGLQTMYAHLQVHLAHGIRVGARVTQGELIGWMGSTGRSTGPHLEWAVFLNHKPVDPHSYVSGYLRN